MTVARASDRAGWASLALGVLAAMALAGVASAATIDIDQKDLMFSMAQVKVARGDTLVFLNDDDTVHNITITGQGFTASSGLQAPGQPFKVRLAKAGVYKVSCGIHPRMKMTVVVQ